MLNIRFRLNYLLHVFLFVSLFTCNFDLLAAEKSSNISEEGKGYTINFDNVPIKEFLRFVSRIAGVNIIYNENELNFNVTIISEESTGIDDIMSALVQVLRINNLSLIEENQNLLIHKNNSVRQIPVVVSEENPLKGHHSPTIMTKVFQIRRGDPSHIAALITPMLSREALVEVSMENRQLIVTDVSGSIETIGKLLLSLDSPDTPYDIDTFIPNNIPVVELEKLAGQLLKPLSEGTLLELVSYPDNGTLFIISTPFLLEKSIAILKDLDQKNILDDHQRILTAENVLIYHLKSKTSEEVKHNLVKIADEAEEQGFYSPGLSTAIKSMKYIKGTNSLLFVGSSDNLKIIQTFLESSDIPTIGSEDPTTKFLLFESEHLDLKQLMRILDEIKKDLKKAKYPHPPFLHAIETSQAIEALNSVLFIGKVEILEEVKVLLDAIEKSYTIEVEKEGTPSFLIYHIKLANEEQIRQSLHHLSDYLETNQYPHEDLIKAINSMHWIKSTNSMIFIGFEKALKELGELLPTFDVPPSDSRSALSQVPLSTDFIIYTPRHTTATQLKEALAETTKQFKVTDLTDPGFLRSLESVRELPSTNQLIFTGDKEAIQRVQVVLQELDQPATKIALQEGPYFIHLKNAEFSKVKNALKKLSEGLSPTDPVNEMISSMKWLADSNVIVLRGSQGALKKVKEVIDLTDSEEVQSKPGSTVVFVHLKHAKAESILKLLKETSAQLSQTKEPPESLIKTLDDAKAVEKTNTIILTGTAEVLAKVQELITANDSANNKLVGMEVFVYRSRYMSPQELRTALMGVAKHAETQSGDASQALLVSTIDTMHTIPDTNTVQFVGTPQTLAKLKELLEVIDNPDHPKATTTAVGADVLIYKVKQQNPEELLSHLKHIATNTGDLGKEDKFERTIKTGRYIPNSHSLVFTGPKAELNRIQLLLTQLDAPGLLPKSAVDRTAEDYQLYKPEHVNGNELIHMLKTFEEHIVSAGVTDHALSEVIDHLTYLPRTNTIILTGPIEAITRALTLLREFDTQEAAGKGGLAGDDEDIETIDETGFLIYKLQNQAGNSLVNALQAISTDLVQISDGKKNQTLINSIRSVQYIEITNSLLATGPPKVLTKLKELLESLDRPLKQVFIEILVLESTIEHDLEFGLKWGSQGTVQNKFGWGTGNYPPEDPGEGFTKNLSEITGEKVPTGADIPPLGGGFLGVIGDIIWHKGKSYASLGSLLNAIKVDRDATIVLSQKIVVQDNQNARIFSGDNIPFTGAIVTTAGLAQTTNANLEYRNVGVTLSITPIIGDHDVLTMDIDQEISEQVNTGEGDGTSEANILGLNGIRTSKTNMTTKVHMPDRHFLILSGTMRNQVTRTIAGIPCLGGLPLIGAAFSETRKLTENRNVIIFVKPHIIKTPEIYDTITHQQEELYGSPEESNVADFHKGLELIRSPDDVDYAEGF